MGPGFLQGSGRQKGSGVGQEGFSTWETGTGGQAFLPGHKEISWKLQGSWKWLLSRRVRAWAAPTLSSACISSQGGCSQSPVGGWFEATGLFPSRLWRPKSKEC